jgi:hypothetical protein
MAFVAANGDQVERARDVVDRLCDGAPPAPWTVVLTFDDGFLDNRHRALPILQRYGCPVDLFTYPFGSYGSWDGAARLALERSGFRGAFTSAAGINARTTGRFQLRRTRVAWCDGLSEFDRLLRGAYDWYALIQCSQDLRARP